MTRDLVAPALIAASTLGAAAQSITLNGRQIPLRCYEWTGNPDGSWTSVGTLNGVPGMEPTIVVDPQQTGLIKQQCSPYLSHLARSEIAGKPTRQVICVLDRPKLYSREFSITCQSRD